MSKELPSTFKLLTVWLLILTGVFLALLASFASLPAHADMTIEIVGGGANRHVIALPAFAAEAGVNGGITPIVRNDLQRSGAFNVLEPGAVANAPSSPGEIDYPAWRGAGANKSFVSREKLRLVLAMFWPTAQRIRDAEGKMDRESLSLCLVGVLLPLSYIGFGLTQVFLAHNSGNMFYLFMCPLVLAALHQRRARLGCPRPL